MAFLTSYWTLDAALVFWSVLVAAYFYTTRNFGHWKSKGVSELLPKPFVGNFGSCVLFRFAVSEYLGMLYKQAKDLPYIGFYIFDKPALVLRDPEIIKTVLVKDFNSFWNRYASSSESDVIGYNNLFLIKNPGWKKLRVKLTSIFSAAKIKNMYSLIDEIGNELIDHLNASGLAGNGRVIELKEMCAKYTTDVIASCAFGLQANCLKNPEADFRKYGKRIVNFNFKRGFDLMGHFFIPDFAKFRGTAFLEATSSDFMRKVFRATLNERLKSGVKRNDLIDLLIELKTIQDGNSDPDGFKFDDDKLLAQAAIFFTAGFETSSTILSFALHELSLQPNLQTKLRNEITAALEESGGKLSYETIHSLPYLDQVVSESLRKYPSLPFLDREARDDYTFEKTGLVIKKGTPIYVPLLGLHYDPEYYPDPEHYDPERFNAENKRQRPSFVYLPFGDGPHNCIGLRFGLMQVKIGIIKIIANHELSPCEQTPNPIRINPKSLTLSSIEGLFHRVCRI